MFLLPEIWIAILTLVFLEIVLGIDNIVFISITAGKLPKDQIKKATRIGLLLAMVFLLILLFVNIFFLKNLMFMIIIYLLELFPLISQNKTN